MMVKIRTAKWKSAPHKFGKLDIEKCEVELEHIKRDVGLTAESIVERASDPESALHDGFTWDDSEAAIRYRLEEARKLLGAVVYVEVTPNGTEREVRAYVNVRDLAEDDDPKTTKGFYIDTKDALKNRKYREQVLTRALEDAGAFADKYRDLEELARIVRAIDTTVKRYAKEHATA